MSQNLPVSAKITMESGDYVICSPQEYHVPKGKKPNFIRRCIKERDAQLYRTYVYNQLLESKNGDV